MLEALLHHQVSLKKMMIVESFFLYIIALSIRRTNTLKVREHFFSYTVERNLIRVTGTLLCQLGPLIHKNSNTIVPIDSKLADTGYKSELPRSLSFFSILGLSFGIIGGYWLLLFQRVLLQNT